MVPFRTSDPGSTSTGTDSPVIDAVSTLEYPVSTIPSAGMRSPGRTSISVGAKAITGLSALAAREPLEAWKDWETFHAIDRRSAYLGKAFQEEAFGIRGIVSSSDPAAFRAPRVFDAVRLRVRYRKDDAFADVLVRLEDDLDLVSEGSRFQMPNPGT